MDDTQPRLAFSYLRFSCAEQSKGSSIKRQTDLRASYCARHNLILDESRTYEDHGVSGFHGKNLVQGHFAEFLYLVRSGVVPAGSVLLIESIDRFSRDQIIPARNALEDLLRAGIEVHTLSPERVYTCDSLKDPFALIGLIFEFARAHEYSLQLGNRLAAAWNVKREKAKNHGTPLTKRPPFWLEVVNGQYQAIEERRQVVELIYQLCADGMGVKLIAKELNRRKIPPFTGKRWSKSYVGKILVEESAIGHHQSIRRDPVTGKKIRAEKIPNLFPPVISETLNAQAKVALRRRKNKGGRVDLDGKIHPFSGLLITHTGAALWIKYRKIGRKNSRLVPYLQDQSNGNCYPLSSFEFLMLGWLAKFEPKPKKQQGHSEITTLEGKIAKLDYKIQTLKDRINSGEEFESFLELLSAAEKERKSSHERLEALRAITPINQGLVIVEGIFERLSSKDQTDHHADHTNQETNLELRAVLRRMIKQIEMTIGQEGRVWFKKSLRVSVTFRDGTKAEFTHKI